MGGGFAVAIVRLIRRTTGASNPNCYQCVIWFLYVLSVKLEPSIGCINQGCVFVNVVVRNVSYPYPGARGAALQEICSTCGGPREEEESSLVAAVKEMALACVRQQLQ